MNTRAPVRECAPNTQALFLVGFMGAGKSSVGLILGQRLGWAFEDLDERIQQREGRSIEQIFEESRAEGRRSMEELWHWVVEHLLNRRT